MKTPIEYEDDLVPVNENPDPDLNVEYLIRVTALDFLRLIGAHHLGLPPKRGKTESDEEFSARQKAWKKHQLFVDEWHAKLISRWRYDPGECWQEVRKQMGWTK